MYFKTVLYIVATTCPHHEKCLFFHMFSHGRNATNEFKFQKIEVCVAVFFALFASDSEKLCKFAADKL